MLKCNMRVPTVGMMFTSETNTWTTLYYLASVSCTQPRTLHPSLFTSICSTSARPQTCFPGGSQFKGVMYMEVTTFGFIFIV